MNCRIYNKDLKPVGTIKDNEEPLVITLRFKKELMKEFDSCVQDFLDKRDLKIVSGYGSIKNHSKQKGFHRTNKRFKKYIIKRQFNKKKNLVLVT